MDRTLLILLCVFSLVVNAAAERKNKGEQDLFPDGKPVPAWFKQTDKVKLSDLGKQYKVTDYGVMDDGRLHTEAFQALIDKVAADGGGVIIVPPGLYYSGALFFRQGTHLHLERGAILKGSDNPIDFPLMKTRMEGETCLYLPGLINADGLDGFTISGEGSLDGNGLRYWKAFWMRRKWNPKCTNKDEQRPRLIYISNCKHVTLCDIHCQNSAFWNTHFYNCSYVKCLGLQLRSPHEPVRAPSSDGIDLDVCHDVLVKNCFFEVDDDAFCLKGGKGPWADDPSKSEGNGKNYDIIAEDNHFGYCHSCFTCGSESIHNHNIIFRRNTVDEAFNLFRLKMRPDTPQRYEYIVVEDIKGKAGNFLLVSPWTQFYDLKGRKDIPMSYSDHITMRNITLDCNTFFNVARRDDQYRLSNFTFENLNIKASKTECDRSIIDGFTYKNVKITDKDK